MTAPRLSVGDVVHAGGNVRNFVHWVQADARRLPGHPAAFYWVIVETNDTDGFFPYVEGPDHCDTGLGEIMGELFGEVWPDSFDTLAEAAFTLDRALTLHAAPAAQS